MALSDRKEREKQQRIKAILGAAKELYARKGYQESSMADIAETSELGKATIYYYFPNKEAIYRELYISCVRDQFQRLGDNILAAATLEELLSQMINAYVDWAYDDPLFFGLHFPMGKNAPVHVLQEPEVVAEMERIHEPVRKRMGEIIRSANARYEPELIAGLTWTYMSGLALKIHQAVPKAALQQEMKIFVDSINQYLLKD
jgi:AcrR family transcriptional regulator